MILFIHLQFKTHRLCFFLILATPRFLIVFFEKLCTYDRVAEQRVRLVGESGLSTPLDFFDLSGVHNEYTEKRRTRTPSDQTMPISFFLNIFGYLQVSVYEYSTISSYCETCDLPSLVRGNETSRKFVPKGLPP